MDLNALRDWAAQENIFSLMGEDLARATWLKHWNKPLAELPEAIGQLRALTKIDLRHNGLRALSEGLGQLHRLEDLTSMGNELASLPDVFHELKRLFYLDMRQNRLQSLPPSLGALERLQMLILRDNLLETLPKEIGQLKQLRRLELCRNPLRTLPAELRHCEALEYLDISGTLISHLPEWLGEMKSLKHLIRGPNQGAEINRALAEDPELSEYAGNRHSYIAPPVIDNEPFQLWFERTLTDAPYGPMKITFRQRLEQDLSDSKIASKAPGMVGCEDWPEGRFVWGEDDHGEFIEYYLSSRWGDRHGRIDRDGTHHDLPALWQIGPIDEEYESLENELRRKGLQNH